jgi:hypothetical protein
MQLGAGTHLTLGTVKLRASKDPKVKFLASVHVERNEGENSLVVSLPLRPNVGTLSIDQSGLLILDGSDEFFVVSKLMVCFEEIQLALFKKFKDMFRNRKTLVTVDRPTELRCCCLDSDLRSGQPPTKLQNVARKRKHSEQHSEPLVVPRTGPTGNIS